METKLSQLPPFIGISRAEYQNASLTIIRNLNIISIHVMIEVNFLYYEHRTGEPKTFSM